MKSLKKYLKESETYGIWDSEATDRTEMGESCGEIKEATMSDIPHEIDDQIHKLKDMRFELEETQKNWELAGLDTTPLSNVITGINELIHSMYNNGAKLADQEVVNESTSHDKEWEIWTLYRRYEDEVNNKWEKDLFSFDTKEEAEKYAKGSRFAGHHVQVVHKGDKPKKLKDLKEDAPLYSKVRLLNESFRKEPEFDMSSNDAFMKSGEERKKWEKELEEKMKRMGNEMGHWGLRASYDVANKISSNRNKIYDEFEKIYNDFDKFMSKYGIKKM